MYCIILIFYFFLIFISNWYSFFIIYIDNVLKKIYNFVYVVELGVLNNVNKIYLKWIY